MSDEQKITCQICGAKIHVVHLHLKDHHPDVTLDTYRAKFPDAPLLSPVAQARVDAAKKPATPAPETAETAMAGTATASVVSIDEARGWAKKALHETFKLGAVKAALNARGEPIPITVLTSSHPKFVDLIPAEDENYVFNIDLLKTALMGFELNVPLYLWGHAGTGKTTLLEQIAAHTRRPFLRVQHTVNTEEAHIVGQWTVKDGHTVFELGPLAVAMKYGLVYCADEYDFAMPSVLSVYQPVLEGKALVIKEADSENRVIRPHPTFRFVATGNTNGCGDETGLYQGTLIQNAANYERFGLVEEVRYMPARQEIMIVAGQAGVDKADAEKLVKFAQAIREQYEGKKISGTISPRALINAAKIGFRRGDWKVGVSLAFTNRLSRVDREVANEYAQRIFG